jgi:CheY-like chemotaxis protein
MEFRHLLMGFLAFWKCNDIFVNQTLSASGDWGIIHYMDGIQMSKLKERLIRARTFKDFSSAPYAFLLVNHDQKVEYYDVEDLRHLWGLSDHGADEFVANLISRRYRNTFRRMLDHCFKGYPVSIKRNIIIGPDRQLVHINCLPVFNGDHLSHVMVNLTWDGQSWYSEDLSFVTSHKLRAPLCNILSLSDLISHPRLENFNYPKIKSLLSDINQQARQLDSILLNLNSLINHDDLILEFSPRAIEKTVRNIVLIDDDPIVNKLHKMLFSKYTDKNVIAFTDPFEALHYVRNNIPDLLLLDLNMPLISGFEFLEKITQLAIKLDVVVVSSSIDASERLRALTYHCVKDFITKPLTFEKIENLIRL